MRQFHHAIRRQKGWILVDGLIALMIIAIGLTTLLSSYIQAEKSSVRNRNYNNAAYLAQSKLEDIKKYDGTATIASLPSDVTNPASITLDGVAFSMHITSLTVINSSSLDSHIYPYQISVSWTDNTLNSPTVRAIQVAAYYSSTQIN